MEGSFRVSGQGRERGPNQQSVSNEVHAAKVAQAVADIGHDLSEHVTHLIQKA
jgi:hypothetical protein